MNSLKKDRQRSEKNAQIFKKKTTDEFLSILSVDLRKHIWEFVSGSRYRPPIHPFIQRHTRINNTDLREKGKDELGGKKKPDVVVILRHDPREFNQTIFKKQYTVYKRNDDYGYTRGIGPGFLRTHYKILNNNNNNNTPLDDTFLCIGDINVYD